MANILSEQTYNVSPLVGFFYMGLKQRLLTLKYLVKTLVLNFTSHMTMAKFYISVPSV